jgi:hypothetical protein
MFLMMFSSLVESGTVPQAPFSRFPRGDEGAARPGAGPADWRALDVRQRPDAMRL